MKRNKIYTKRAPYKEGKLYFIFCEGEKKETTYFYFFNRIASQIVIQIVPIKDGRNSPMGLYNNACQNLVASDANPIPVYSMSEGDEVWFIIDTDKWGEEINTLREHAAKHKNWFVGQSNPCFEVWLYCHFIKSRPATAVDNWKTFLNGVVKGGFNPGKHPVYIESAIGNAEANFSMEGNEPAMDTTELFMLGKKIVPLVKADIDLLLRNEV